MLPPCEPKTIYYAVEQSTDSRNTRDTEGCFEAILIRLRYVTGLDVCSSSRGYERDRIISCGRLCCPLSCSSLAGLYLPLEVVKGENVESTARNALTNKLNILNMFGHCSSTCPCT